MKRHCILTSLTGTPPRENRMKNAVLLTIFFLIFFTLTQFETFEALFEFSREHESWDLDELIMAIPAMLIVLMISAFLDKRTLRKEVLCKSKLQQALVSANAKLQAHKDNLEQLVLKKAGLLQKANKELAREISEKESINVKLLHAMEDAISANNTKTRFLATMSHEIRTPLNGLIGMVRLAAENPSDDESRNFLRLALKAGHTLSDLINDTLEILRMDSGKMPLSIRSFSLREVLSDVVMALRPLAEKKSLELSTHIPASVPDALRGDQGKLAQILTNLVNNSIKFTHEGSVSVHVSCTAENSQSQIALRIDVKDTGIGIPFDRLEGLFDPFTQAHDNQAVYGGTGLGLAISKNLAELLGGSIEVESNGNTGSCFTLLVAFSPGQPFTVDENAAGEATLARMAILLAEDNEINQLYMSSVLKRQGHEVSIAQNGVDVLDRLRSDHFDVVLMDLEMPEMDGITSTMAIRRGEAGEKNTNIPIIALTAHAFNDHRQQTFEAGMNAFLPKPIAPDALNQALAALLPHRLL